MSTYDQLIDNTYRNWVVEFKRVGSKACLEDLDTSPRRELIRNAPSPSALGMRKFCREYYPGLYHQICGSTPTNAPFTVLRDPPDAGGENDAR